MDKPVAFKRKDDGELFTLNYDCVTYSLEFMKREFPNSLHMKYEAKHLQNNKFTPIWNGSS
jgi:hypothetical protein